MWPSRVISKFTDKSGKVIEDTLDVLTGKENVLVIQLHPKSRVAAVSYKGQVKKIKFLDNSIKKMLKGGPEFEPTTYHVFGGVVRAIAELIKYY